jgi:hypothetical protein
VYRSLRDEPTTNRASEQRRRSREQPDIALVEVGLLGAPYHDQRTPHGAVGDERASEFWAVAARGEQFTKARAALGATRGRRCERRSLLPRPRELGELVDVVDRVLVVLENRKVILDVLQAVLRDQA